MGELSVLKRQELEILKAKRTVETERGLKFFTESEVRDYVASRFVGDRIDEERFKRAIQGSEGNYTFDWNKYWSKKR